jgi:hypothetical protein
MRESRLYAEHLPELFRGVSADDAVLAERPVLDTQFRHSNALVDEKTA